MSTLHLSLIGLGSRVAIIAVSMVNTILLARVLEPHGRGQYFVLVTFVSVITVLADAGLTQSANVFCGRHGALAGRIHSILIRCVLVLWAGAALVCGGVLWLAGEKMLPNLPGAWVAAAFLALPLALYASFWNGMMVGLGRIWALNLLQLAGSVLAVILTLIVVVGLSGGVAGAVGVYLATTLVQALFMLFMVRPFERPTPDDVPIGLARQMLFFGLRGYPNAVSALLWSRVPVFFLNVLHGASTVGIFSVAQVLAERALLPVQAMQDAIYRKMATLPRSEAAAAMNRYVRLTWVGISLVALAGIVLGRWAVVLVFGEAYAEAGQVLRVLLVGAAVMGGPMLLGAYFLSTVRRPGLLSILAWLNLLISVLLAAVCIPAWGAVGAAIGLTMTQVLGTGIIVVIYMRMSQTPVTQVLGVHRGDLALLRDRVRSRRWVPGVRS